MEDNNNKKVPAVVPTQNYLLCTEFEANERQGGLFIPDGISARNNKRALVLKAGPGRIINGQLEQLTCKPGDIVLLPNVGYAEIMIEDRPYYVLRDDSVMFKCVDQYAGED